MIFQHSFIHFPHIHMRNIFTASNAWKKRKTFPYENQAWGGGEEVCEKHILARGCHRKAIYRHHRAKKGAMNEEKTPKKECYETRSMEWHNMKKLSLPVHGWSGSDSMLQTPPSPGGWWKHTFWEHRC